jgi:ATP adenylyltransferase/5',5'''-P-1,P-4-tetraphosphate phosphorylase II
MVLNKRKDEIIGSFDNHRDLIMLYYDDLNDCGLLEIKNKQLRSNMYRFVETKEITHLINLLTKLKKKMNNTFDEKEYIKTQKEIDEEFNIK